MPSFTEECNKDLTYLQATGDPWLEELDQLLLAAGSDGQGLSAQGRVRVAVLASALGAIQGGGLNAGQLQERQRALLAGRLHAPMGG